MNLVSQKEGTKRLRVAVLMGGRSIENEVSFNSGRTICDHLDTERYTPIPLFQTQSGELYILPYRFLHRGKTTDFLHRLKTETKQLVWDELPNLVDFVYIATHGRFAEDGTLQGMLEVMRIPYLGPGIFASALRMDKGKHKNILKAHGIDVPRFALFSCEEIKNESIDLIALLEEKGVSFPCVVKPCNEGSSLGVSVVFKPEELRKALQSASKVDPRIEKAVIVEECLEGMEFSSIILADPLKNDFIVLPPTEIVPIEGTHFFDYEQKYMPGRSIKFTPPRCSQETVLAIQSTCHAVMNILEFKTIARIDGFVTKDNRVVIIDPNSLSGMDPTSFFFRAAAEIGMNHTQVINHLIDAELYARGIDCQKKGEQKMEKTDLQNMRKKIRVAVLMGGESHEREISLESGRNVTYKLSPHKYEPIPLFVSEDMKLYRLSSSLLVRNSTKEIASLIDDTMHILWSDLPKIADFVFIALHGGLGENGGVQGSLEMLDMPYNGSGVFASGLCMDKYKTADFLKIHGFETPKNMLILDDFWQDHKEAVCAEIRSKFSFPVIIKPHDDGCSVLVSKAQTMEKLIQAVDAIFVLGKQKALIEEFLVGMELTVGILGNDHAYALPPSQAIAAGGILSIEEKFLPGAGENQTPAPLPEKTLRFVQREIEQVFKAIDCRGYARIDCFYQNEAQSSTGKERVVVLEVNSLPGLTPATCIFHQAAELGMKPMEFIDRIIELGFENHKEKLRSQLYASVLEQSIEQ